MDPAIECMNQKNFNNNMEANNKILGTDDRRRFFKPKVVLRRQDTGAFFIFMGIEPIKIKGTDSLWLIITRSVCFKSCFVTTKKEVKKAFCKTLQENCLLRNGIILSYQVVSF